MNATRFNRRLFLAVPLAVMACGFQPAYGPGGPAQGIQSSIRVADPSDKNAFDLVERLEERLGRPKNERFDLTYTIKTTAVGVGITPDNAITRYNLNGTIDWALTNRTTNARVTGGQVKSFTSYSATGSTVAGLAAQEDAARRLMRILADQITARLLATSGTWNQ
ncbi:MAG: LPS assembly lipoprotein LptE [Cypionkella sp.]|uniref:LPS assembly lipoprotein LptE n=1 Tax=Cypionkella sp. TaxID=2811411 RepID=UPI002ABAA1FB|nr:LPS assembly lipoprotein LptE [Cypionkella sp.]MDZ4309017.1 LPS assembly lipoprotein LptE [Cypionkella sp.]